MGVETLNPLSNNFNHTSGDGPPTSSLRNSQAQPPAETQNAHVVFSKKIKSPIPPSTDQELVTPLTSPSPAPDTLQSTTTCAATTAIHEFTTLDTQSFLYVTMYAPSAGPS